MSCCYCREGTDTNMGSSGICVIKRPLPLAPELYDLCHNLFVSWSCIKDRMWFLESDIQEAMEPVMHTLLQTARQKCKGKTIAEKPCIQRIHQMCSKR